MWSAVAAVVAFEKQRVLWGFSEMSSGFKGWGECEYSTWRRRETCCCHFLIIFERLAAEKLSEHKWEQIAEVVRRRRTVWVRLIDLRQGNGNGRNG